MKPRQVKKLNNEARNLLLSIFNGEFTEDDFKIVNGVLMCYFRVLFDYINDREEYEWIEARYALYYQLAFKELTIKECRKLAKAGAEYD